MKRSEPKQASSVKLNEIWLLILRMLALAILVFIIASPVIKSKVSGTALTYLIEPSLLQHDEIDRILDTIDSDAELRLLDINFPAYTPGEEGYSEDIPDYWKLAVKMEEMNSDSIVVLTAAYLKGFKGRRPQTPGHINWIQIIPDDIINAPVAAIRKGDEIEIVSVAGDHSHLQIKKEIIFADNVEIKTTGDNDSLLTSHSGNEKYIPLRIQDSLKVSLFVDEDMEEQMSYISSSLNAISQYLNIPVKITELNSGDGFREEQDLIIWLSNSLVDPVNNPILKWQPDSLANSLIVQGDRDNVHFLTANLDSENIVEEHFPEQLLKILNINNELEKEILKHDRRVMPLDEIVPVTGSSTNVIDMFNSEDISKYLWWLLGILLIAERGLSVYRKQ